MSSLSPLSSLGFEPFHLDVDEVQTQVSIHHLLVHCLTLGYVYQKRLVKESFFLYIYKLIVTKENVSA